MRHLCAVQRARGFTLIELMIVVAIVGILAVLGVYGVRKYLANAKTAEATNALGRMAKSESIQYERESMAGAVLGQGGTAGASRALCATEQGGSTVPAVTKIKGQKYQSSVSDWNWGSSNNAGFSCLKFNIEAPQYYAYSYVASGTSGAVGDSFTGTANGDLNGDGVMSTFTIQGAINPNLALNIAPNFVSINPEE